MKKSLLILTSCFFLPVFSSCIKDDLKDCDRNLRIEFEWIETDPRNPQEEIQLTIQSDDRSSVEIDLTAPVSGRDVTLRPETYRVVGWEPAENISVIADTVKLAVGTDGYALTPGAFNGGDTVSEVDLSIANQVIPVPMRQQTRPLCFRVFFSGDGSSALKGLDATLEGVTLERNINEAFPPASGLARPKALRNGSAQYAFSWDEDHWQGTRRLIGIDGDAPQLLHLTASFDGGITNVATIDVTGEFFGYHTQSIHEPWCITINVDLTEILVMTITDWYGGAESWIVAQ